MTYDFILMNPPYDKNLHLKIVEQSIPMLTDNGILVNLSPIRWLQDSLAKYKKSSDYCKFEESVAKHIKDLVVVSGEEAAEVFNAAMIMDLGIYVIDKGTYDLYKKFNCNSIVDKVVDKETEVLNDKLEYNVSDGWRVRLSGIRPVATEATAKSVLTSNVQRSALFETTHFVFSWVYKDGYTKDGKHWTENVFQKASRGGYDKSSNLPISISFKPEKEAVNFENSTKTTFHRYLVLKMKTDQNFPMNYVPFMGECINPRTGKKGYESDWTDDDFRQYFDITDNEWKEIECTMKPYL